MYDHPMIKAGVKVSAALMLVALAVPSFAEDSSQSKSKFEVHGFLTQAWATGKFLKGPFPNPDGSPAGPTQSEISLGIPEDGTFDYRTMAIQFRYAISDKDLMIVQLSSRSLGDSPITEAENEIELDWAFYERKLADNTAVKVGRVQIPNGIFNEIRDVGTILPFFRPAYGVYQEGSFTTETVDGVNLSHTFAADSDWSVDADVYVGQWDLVEIDLFNGQAVTATAEDSYGAQLWLNTPVSGLRFGLAYQHRKVFDGTLRLPNDPTSFDDILFSVDSVFDKWIFRGEYRRFTSDPDIIPVLLSQDFETEIEPYYVQVGWHPTDELRFYLQYESTTGWANSSSFTRDYSLNLRKDTSIAFNYVFSPNVVFKAEYHEVEEGYQAFVPVFRPTGVLLDPLLANVDGGNYTIVSLSASF